MSTEATFQQAMAFHEQGLLDRAEVLYGEILRSEQDHVEALHLLGLIGLARGDHAGAIRLIGAALTHNPGHAVAHGNLGIAFLQQRRYTEALGCFDEAVEIAPQFAAAHYNRANVLLEMQRYEEAVQSFDRCLAVEPGHAEAHNNRGDALLSLQRPEEALRSFERALQLAPQFPIAHHNRGHALLLLKRPAEALPCFDQALQLQPDYVEAHHKRGNALSDLRHFEEALASFERALRLRPNYPGALHNRAIVLGTLNRLAEAVESCNLAIAIDPGYATAYNLRGNVLLKMLEPRYALDSFTRALELRPDNAEILNNCGNASVLSYKHEDAVACFRRLLQVAPRHPYVHGALAHSQLHCCDWSDYATSAQRAAAQVMAGEPASTPGCLLSFSDSPEAQHRCAQIHVADLYPPAARPLWEGEIYKHDRIRVAYLSADFHNHVTAHLAARLFEVHDRKRFEVTAISFGPDDGSPMRARLKRGFDRFVDVRSMDDASVARLLRDQEIDIAVDLKGFTDNARMAILAQRPAPIQVNYLGYPGTLGAPYIDYIVADHEVIPQADQVHYSEQVAYLPGCYQVNDSNRAINTHAPTRSQMGLPANGLVFCSFNGNYKITPPLFDIWMRLLQRVPGSVLWLLQSNHRAAENLRREAVVRGVDSDRLVFAPWITAGKHLARMQAADLFLDTLPVTAHSTASDALWASVPVLTCRGRGFAARVAASLLTALELPSLITDSLDEYERRAFELATTPGLLARMRETLVANRDRSALFSTERFCRHLESAYVHMYERYQRGLPPSAFCVPASADG
jgi:predicted O-linked N-acetylglucosamine transferase (SPINDLY family)